MPPLVKKLKILMGLVLVASLVINGYAWAKPSSGFREMDGELFDDWQISRTRSSGEDGFYQVTKTTFRPVVAFESLGENEDLAYRMGQQFAREYPDKMQRAEAVFNFVRDRVRYTTDIDQYGLEEFAQNADELAAVIDESGVAYGDCEDSAVLLSIMYKAAGYRSAIAIAPGHTASLVHLPGYNKVAAVFELDGETGWVWAEATGKTNPLGWVPKEIIDSNLAAYEISAEKVERAEPTKAPSVVVAGGGGSSSLPLPFFSIIILLWLVSLFRRKR